MTKLRKLTKKTLFIMIMLLMLILFNNSLNNHVIAETYLENTTDFRAVWVSYYTGNIKYTSETQYKKDIDEILDTLEFYNMNAIIFHVRANHDAWYNSKINRINSQLKNVDFDEFDPLEYVITESHKRGIEFHAWMNPYRIGSSTTYSSTSSAAADFVDYPNNPASNESNILVGKALTILDPGIPEVRDFLIDTCLELVENYDVDAIHFDDYFYADGIDDSKTRSKYNTGLSTSDFRRAQVDTFIETLDETLEKFNKENNKYVQLGIAPTGVYKNASTESEANTSLSDYRYNANGDLIYPTGATTKCQMHYESYLYCDTLKWVNNEWIDYILPQTYWGTTHQTAPFEKLINWWNMAVKNKKVNLYSGMGIYMWTAEVGEASKQLTITSNLENVKGTSIYSYKQVEAGYTKQDSYAYSQMTQIKNNAWYNKTILPEIRTFESVNPGSVTDLVVTDNRLTFSSIKEAKFYIVYRNVDTIQYTNDEIVDIIYSKENTIEWVDTESGNYIYDVLPLSYTNTLGSPSDQLVVENNPNIAVSVDTTSDGTNKILVNTSYNLKLNNTAYIFLNEGAPDTSRLKYNWTSSNEDVATVSQYGTITTHSVGTTKITGTYVDDTTQFCEFYLNVYIGDISTQSFTVKFIDSDGSLLKTETVSYGSSATPPTNLTKADTKQFKFTFIGWNKNYTNITSDVTIKALYLSELQKYQVLFKNMNGEVLKTELVEYGKSANAPSTPTLEPSVEYSYKFKEWDKDFSCIEDNLTVTAVYYETERYYTLKYDTNGGDQISSDIYTYFENVTITKIPKKEGLVFDGWYLDEELSQPCTYPMNLTCNTTVYAKWSHEYEITYYDNNGENLNTIKILEGYTLDEYVAPNIEGYVFIGWSTDKNSSDIFSQSTPINQNYSLYPVYVRAYVVSFYDYNGSLIVSEIVQENRAATAPEVEQLKGYTFTGWDKDFDNVTSDLSVFAMYELIDDNYVDNNCKCGTNILIILGLISSLSTCLVLLRKKLR